MLGRAGLVLLLAMLALLLAPALGSAHSANPNINTLVTGTRPALPGVTITTIQSSIAPALSASNGSRRSLEVLGPDGVPFLRIGPGGAFGNVDTPAFYLSGAPDGETSVPPGVQRLRGRVRWVRLSRQPAWAWYDARVPAIVTAPAAVENRTTPTRLQTFTIPLRYAGQAAQALGEVDYQPPTGGPVATMTSPMVIYPGITVALLPGARPDVYLQDSGSRVVTVEGPQGEPFAQIGPQGVRVNVLSPIHEADAIARGGRAVVRLEGSRAPRYQRVSSAPSYDWLDPRPRLEPRWRIPLLIDGRTYYITGTLRFQAATTVAALLRRARGPRRAKADGPLTAGVIVAVIAGALLAAGAFALTRRRRALVRRRGA